VLDIAIIVVVDDKASAITQKATSLELELRTKQKSPPVSQQVVTRYSDEVVVLPRD
jgi:hypothetical protein